MPLIAPPNAENLRYLQTKQEKLGHLLGLAVDDQPAADRDASDVKVNAQG